MDPTGGPPLKVIAGIFGLDEGRQISDALLALGASVNTLESGVERLNGVLQGDPFATDSKRDRGEVAKELASRCG